MVASAPPRGTVSIPRKAGGVLSEWVTRLQTDAAKFLSEKFLADHSQHSEGTGVSCETEDDTSNRCPGAGKGDARSLQKGRRMSIGTT